ncbi:hypothetical protein OIDMADRAFT_61629 [Oidiodendron maius Zn]|uniref:Uncharacterized protein n=1 Tax=Oidiodendron maius (strain Zn) TaxID=913774 RepID=A0A0C3C3L2_OIDMZ|nr:hypothetical protein OIDMADRAFT_61629 [Oidiodendron maius Zn]
MYHVLNSPRAQIRQQRVSVSLRDREFARFLGYDIRSTNLLQDQDDGLGFVRSNPRTPKPRELGVTEIRGPYYSTYGKRHLQVVMDTLGHHVDVVELIDIAHENDVYVSTGGFMEHALMHPDVLNVVDRYLQKCKDVGGIFARFPNQRPELVCSIVLPEIVDSEMPIDSVSIRSEKISIDARR